MAAAGAVRTTTPIESVEIFTLHRTHRRPRGGRHSGLKLRRRTRVSREGRRCDREASNRRVRD